MNKYLKIICSLFLSSFIFSSGFCFTIAEPDAQGDITPSSFATFNENGGTLKDPNGINIVVPKRTFLTPTTVALYMQPVMQLPELTVPKGYEIIKPAGLSLYKLDKFSKPITVEISYAKIKHIAGRRISGFYFNPAKSKWFQLKSKVDRKNKVVSFELARPGLFALGSKADTKRPLIPRVIMYSLMIFALLVILKFFNKLPVLLFVLSLSALTVFKFHITPVFASDPKFTSKGRPINHSKFIKQVTIHGKKDGKLVLWHITIYELWRYNPAIKKWSVTPLVRMYPESLKKPHSAPGLKPSTPSYIEKYKAYDCTGFALRDKSMVPGNPDVEGRAILEDEYNEVKAPPDCPRKGDILVYKSTATGAITHFAVISKVKDCTVMEVTSKWGRGFLYEHPPMLYPAAYGKPDGVYRKK
ncbi:MAG: hypothetical protein JW871_05995 [Endomicrobiales bacterium]|nr:hypothetical protein [Endomicrobiales bacterium]